MALHQVNILDTLGLTVRSEDLETRLKTIERALQDQPQLQSTLARLKVPRQGFTDWRVSLLRFDGDAEQTDQARRQRAAAAELLNQIDNNLYNLSQRLEETANTPSSSTKRSTNSSTSSAQPQNRTARPLPSLAPTDEEPPEDPEEDTVPPLAHRQSTNSYVPPPRRASSGGSIYNNVKSKNNAKMMCGTYYAASVVAHSQPLPQAPSSEWNNIEATDDSMMHLGDSYGATPFAEVQEPEEMAPTSGIFRRFTGKISRKQSMKQ
ncbi:hypothetical protein OHC33_005204 [Knufia fluminis]|uniref:Uncharacterized protein n=1 Tax=Knufia fluminis TaxID=191047 RepID=A0AAN8EL96_9EURO|nr:hypothetical protein OHC33_005204 [Knufia fluminis]